MRRRNQRASKSTWGEDMTPKEAVLITRDLIKTQEEYDWQYFLKRIEHMSPEGKERAIRFWEFFKAQRNK